MSNHGTTQTPITTIAALRVDHVCIGAADFEGIIRWYQEFLGFHEEKRWSVEAVPGLRLAYLEANGFRIEIIGNERGVHPSVPTGFADLLAMQGLQHLCFWTDDVDEVVSVLKQRGVQVFVPPEDYPTGAERRVAFIKDPEGNLIEFAGPLKGSTAR